MRINVISRRFTIRTAACVAIAYCCFGCNSNIVEVRKDLATHGYALWYPPEQGIEPGQIWLVDGALKTKFIDRPDALPVQESRAHFATLEERVDARQSLTLLFTRETMGKAGLLTKELNDSGVWAVTLDLGKQQVVEISPKELIAPEAKEKFGAAFTAAVDLVRDDAPGIVLISSVVRISGMRYTLRLDDPLRLMNRMSEIQRIVDAPIDAQIVGKDRVQWKVAGNRKLAIGFTPVRGTELSLDAKGARQSAAKTIHVAQAQPEIIASPVRIAPATQPVLSSDAAADQVQVRYRQFVKDADLYWRHADLGQE